MSISARTRNPRGQGGRLREEIVGAAITLIDETDAPVVLTLRGIARRAQISAPSIYGHFPDLESILEAVLADSFEQLSDAVAAAINAEHDAVSSLIAAGLAYVQFGWTHRARYRLMFDASGYAPNAVHTYTLVEDLIARCAATGQSQSTDPHHDAWMLWAGLHGVTTLQKPSRAQLLRLGPLDRPAMLRSIICRLARIAEPA